jgi:hypothetical protein
MQRRKLIIRWQRKIENKLIRNIENDYQLSQTQISLLYDLRNPIDQQSIIFKRIEKE